MSASRIFIGRLSHRVEQRDVEEFFHGYGKVKEVVLKNGYGFVELGSNRDAEDAVHDLNGKELCGGRVNVELSRARPGGRFSGGSGGFRSNYGSYGGGRDYGGQSFRYDPPRRTRYRLTVENLSTRCAWQDLKTMMRECADVTFADAHNTEKNVGIVCFTSHSGLKRAMEKFQGKDINGRRIKLVDDTLGERSRSRSRSPRRRRRSNSRSHSDSRSSSPARKKSPVSRRNRSRSSSPILRKSPVSRSPSRSRSPAPKKSPVSRRNRSRSSSPILRKSPVARSSSHSRSPARKKSPSVRSRSRSLSPAPKKSPINRHNRSRSRSPAPKKSPTKRSRSGSRSPPKVKPVRAHPRIVYDDDEEDVGALPMFINLFFFNL